MSEDTVSKPSKRVSVWFGQEIEEDFWAKVEPQRKESPKEPAKVLSFPKK